MRRPFALLAATLLLGAGAAPASAADGDDAGAGNESFTIRDPRITESSGLAASRLHPGVYWTHNDSDDGAHLYAVDSATGETVARITFTGVGSPRDVEGISIGPDNRIFVGDIGDNLGGTWPHVWIYELPEPKELRDQTVRATQYVVTYSDGARDAESLVVHPKTGRVYIVDKKEEGGHLYEGPAELSASGGNVFRPVAPVDLWATDAAFSPDGRELAVRSYFGGIQYAWDDATDGKIERKGRLSVPLAGQGESVSYSADGSRLMYGSEGEQSPVESREVPGGGGAGGGGGESSGGGGSAADGEDGAGGDGLGAGVVGVVVVGAVLLGLRRLFWRS
ncbi:WD40 repeat domain-containing protein [Streptomyces sp. NPDC057433]|uniref:WD40 repeat domain-containing protein n=1 Tax=Streptomyces sp. NPDC057433 TaxID=3346132 RepID=UPI0036ADE0AB